MGGDEESEMKTRVRRSERTRTQSRAGIEAAAVTPKKTRVCAMNRIQEENDLRKLWEEGARPSRVCMGNMEGVRRRGKEEERSSGACGEKEKTRSKKWIPKNRYEAMRHEDWEKFREAEEKELETLMRNGTWKVEDRDRMPKGRKALRTKWVYDIKYDKEGNIIKYKARLVAMGCNQKEGVDYFHTMASVMNIKGFRIALATWNAESDTEMEHWDVTSAFTNAEVEEDIWIAPPEGYQTGAEGKVCKLVKALYGTKQAGNAWQKLVWSP